VDRLSHQYAFTSDYLPAYSTAKDVRVDLATALERFSDTDIWHIIRDNTVYLQKNIRNDYIPEEESFDDIDGSDFYMRAWVKIKSQIDSLYGSYASVALRLGSEKHQLGFLDINKSTKLPYIDDLLGKLKDDLHELDILLFGFHPQHAVKGGKSYPYNPNRNNF
jgi:hypothetical protein